MTEDEAKTKWCPFTRVADVNGKGCANRFDGSSEAEAPIGSLCFGAACMAWQFDQTEYEMGTPLPLGTVPADPGWEEAGETWCAGGEYGSGQNRMRWRRALPRTGYCRAFDRP